MKMILIGLAALLLLGGGGAGAYFYMFSNEAEASTGEEAKMAEKKKEVDHSKLKFVEMDPLILPIVDNNGVSQTVSLVVVLEVLDDKAASEVEEMTPRLKDAYIQDMYGTLSRHAALKGGVLQVSVLKDRLSKISHKVVGDDKIHDVLLQVVQQRPI